MNSPIDAGNGQKLENLSNLPSALVDKYSCAGRKHTSSELRDSCEGERQRMVLNFEEVRLAAPVGENPSVLTMYGQA